MTKVFFGSIKNEFSTNGMEIKFKTRTVCECEKKDRSTECFTVDPGRHG